MEAKILCSDPIDKICVDVFKSRGHEVDALSTMPQEELMKIIGEYEGLVVRSGTKVTEEVLGAAKKLKLVGRAGTGVDNINLKAATKAGILVLNTPGGNTISTAELTLSHILALSRNIPQAVASLKSGQWDRKSFTGTELTGKTLGVIGLGRIGREVAHWCSSMGMHVIGYDPILAEGAARAAGVEPVPLPRVLAEADFITVHTPLTDQTRNLFNAESLATCKRGVRLVNVARGGIINEEALLAALESGQVAGAALDVFTAEPPPEHLGPLVRHPRVIATPHLGASTQDAQVRVARDIAAQMCDILDGTGFVGVVNAPKLDYAKKSPQLLGYVGLAEKLGALQAQLLGPGKVRRIVVQLAGRDLGVPDMVEAIKVGLLKGALGSLLAQEVSYLNAGLLAEEVGLPVKVSTAPAAENDYANALTVHFEVDGMLNGRRSITGTVFPGTHEQRVVDIDGFRIDLDPAGHMLFFNNLDRPGVLKEVAGTLAAAGVNIGYFSLGRAQQGSTALGLLKLDEAVDKATMERLRSLEDVFNVQAVELEAADEDAAAKGGGGGDAFSGYISGDNRPQVRPENPEFSSGPCKKRPGYDVRNLYQQALGRSHRSKLGKGRLQYSIELSKQLLRLPEDYRLGIVPASDTGAFEMAMWSMLGPRPVDMCYWESFGKGWFGDATSHLGLQDVTEHAADYGHLPDLSKTNPDSDICFTWNGTTSGVKVPNADWVAADRGGLTLCDATSAAFAMEIDWPKVDVLTYSWQKVLGGEGGHGVLVLSPRAVERLESFTPANRPLPKIFRMTKKGKLDESIWKGSTINTPSMLAVEDYIDALEWGQREGGLEGLIARSTANFQVLEKFVARHDWIHFLAQKPEERSNTSVCLTLDLPPEKVKLMIALLEAENVALDIGAYRDAPAGLRIWCGATVEKEDVEALMPWLKWAYEEVKDS